MVHDLSFYLRPISENFCKRITVHKSVQSVSSQIMNSAYKRARLSFEASVSTTKKEVAG